MFLERPRELGPGTLTLRNATNARVIATHTEAALTRGDRRRGLLGRDSLPPGHAMLIAPCTSVHTWFMRFTIDVIFVKRDGSVVKTCRAVRPWRMAMGWGAYATVELPVGSIEAADVKAGDQLELL
jgi:uncharacterized membrane protein (UPF0127 family)